MVETLSTLRKARYVQSVVKHRARYAAALSFPAIPGPKAWHPLRNPEYAVRYARRSVASRRIPGVQKSVGGADNPIRFAATLRHQSGKKLLNAKLPR